MTDIHDFAKIRSYINGTPVEVEFADITPEEREFYVLQNVRQGRLHVNVFPIRFNITCDFVPPLGAFVSLHMYSVYEEDVLRLPRSAMNFDRYGDYVLRLVDGRQEQVYVEVIHTPTYVVILSGLEEGDVVIVR